MNHPSSPNRFYNDDFHIKKLSLYDRLSMTPSWVLGNMCLLAAAKLTQMQASIGSRTAIFITGQNGIWHALSFATNICVVAGKYRLVPDESKPDLFHSTRSIANAI